MPRELDESDSDFKFKDTEHVKFQPNHALMSRMTPHEQTGKPQKIFFLRNIDLPDGQNVIAFPEKEAAMLLNRSSYKHVYRIFGCSDGSAYRKYIMESGLKPGQIVDKEKAEQILREAMLAEMEAAKGHMEMPIEGNVHFDQSFPMEQRQGFVPPK